MCRSELVVLTRICCDDVDDDDLCLWQNQMPLPSRGRCINGRALEEELGLGGCVARLS
jgi:hypothetical protein